MRLFSPLISFMMSVQLSNTQLSESAAAASRSPRRRQRAPQPPSLLTTSLGNAQNAGLGLGLYDRTPVSTTSLSSPFSIHQPTSMYPASPGGALRGSSPMALRSTESFNAPYNPQQWRPSSTASSIPASGTTFSTTQHRQQFRLAPSTVQPRGPDGELFMPLTQKENAISNTHRTRRVPTATLFSTSVPRNSRV